MQRFFENLDYATALPLAAQVAYQPGQIAGKSLVQNTAVSMTLFAFDQGGGISAHTSTGDALVQALNGQGQVSIDGQATFFRTGEARVMRAGHPHAVSTSNASKCCL